jgi:hypothetical protein
VDEPIKLEIFNRLRLTLVLSQSRAEWLRVSPCPVRDLTHRFGEAAHHPPHSTPGVDQEPQSADERNVNSWTHHGDTLRVP